MRVPSPRRLLLAAAFAALTLYVALGYRDAGPSLAPADQALVARARALNGQGLHDEYRAIDLLQRQAKPQQAVASDDPALLEAAQRLAALAEIGNPHAAYRLGWYYLNGWGLERDRCNAVEWFYAAARQGHPQAQFWLAMAYLPPNGQGVRPDKTTAFLWASAAREQGLDAAIKLFQFFTQDFSPAERAAAESALAGWTPATAATPQIERFPYVPILVGLWPRQTHHIMPCRQEHAPYEDWQPE